jgi:hypothetical protein
MQSLEKVKLLLLLVFSLLCALSIMCSHSYSLLFFALPNLTNSILLSHISGFVSPTKAGMLSSTTSSSFFMMFDVLSSSLRSLSASSASNLNTVWPSSVSVQRRRKPNMILKVELMSAQMQRSVTGTMADITFGTITVLGTNSVIMGLMKVSRVPLQVV